MFEIRSSKNQDIFDRSYPAPALTAIEDRQD
jgi:hypothetical protein